MFRIVPVTGTLKHQRHQRPDAMFRFVPLCAPKSVKCRRWVCGPYAQSLSSFILLSSLKRGTVEQVKEVPAAQWFLVFRPPAQSGSKRNIFDLKRPALERARRLRPHKRHQLPLLAIQRSRCRAKASRDTAFPMWPGRPTAMATSSRDGGEPSLCCRRPLQSGGRPTDDRWCGS